MLKLLTPAYCCVPIELMAFRPLPFSSEERRLKALCPVCALCMYMERLSVFWEIYPAVCILGSIS